MTLGFGHSTLRLPCPAQHWTQTLAGVLQRFRSMSSLPACVASAFDLSDELNTIATIAPPTRNETGSTMSNTKTMMIGPKSTATFLSEEGPRLDFDERTDG